MALTLGALSKKLLPLTSLRSLSSKVDILNYETTNEPIYEYKPGSPEREALEKTIKEYESSIPKEVPICIGDEEIKVGDLKEQQIPFDHKRILSKFYYAPKEIIKKAIDTSLSARRKWERTPIEERATVFLRAADLIAGKYRPHIIAATMLGQGKTIYQAEIDAAPELIDFMRFNVMYAGRAMKYKPADGPSAVNFARLRGMEGFWAAISPFNFTAIGGHLALAPALMGNVVVWKPTDTAVLSNHLAYSILREAGLPPGVINFVPADGPTFGDVVCSDPNLAGINFTGSVGTFRTLYKKVGMNIDNFKSFPRLIGECGGKNYHFVHPSADLEVVVNSTVRSAFEYGGQKCSACSRLYVPESQWDEIREKLVKVQKDIRVDSPLVQDAFFSAVIDEKAFDRIQGYIDYAKSSPNLKVVAGGNCDKSKGYFVEPTILETSDPHDKIMQEEIFGPVVTVYRYPDDKIDETLEMVNTTSPYGLTGAIFAKDDQFIEHATEKLRDSAGNFYVNNPSTGSIVGQQPFGGLRLSGTNDKSGGPYYIMKFASMQSIKNEQQRIDRWQQSHMG